MFCVGDRVKLLCDDTEYKNQPGTITMIPYHKLYIVVRLDNRRLFDKMRRTCASFQGGLFFKPTDVVAENETIIE